MSVKSFDRSGKEPAPDAQFLLLTDVSPPDLCAPLRGAGGSPWFIPLLEKDFRSRDMTYNHLSPRGLRTYMTGELAGEA